MSSSGVGDSPLETQTAVKPQTTVRSLSKGVSTSSLTPAASSRNVGVAELVSELERDASLDATPEKTPGKGVLLFSVVDTVAGETRDLIEVSSEQTRNSSVSLQFIVPQLVGGGENPDLNVILRDSDDSGAVAMQLAFPHLRQAYVIAARQYIILSGQGHNFSPDLQWYANKVLPPSAVEVRLSQDAAEWSADLARRWLTLAERASIHHGDLRITAPEQLPSDILLVVGNVDLEFSGQLQCSILATGRIRVRCRQAFFKPLVDNVLFFSEGGIDINGGDNGFRGDLAALNGRLRIQGCRQRFASGSLWGRHVFIRGECQAFISD